MPDGRAALAASDGVVSFAANTPRGWTVIIDHAPRKLSTYYTHLSALRVTRGKRSPPARRSASSARTRSMAC
jgi:murein DD-endopeptidase MepM/ murein hydrolase activator NlpD